MKENESRHVDIVDCQEMKCVYCGYCNEINRSLLDIEGYWIEADLVEFCCTKCGKPFMTSKQLEQSREAASVFRLV
jgi:hypothetical protein